MEYTFDVVIVGAGPGGLACAKYLAEKGKKVVILEKNSVVGNKVCAGGVTAKEIGGIAPKKLLGQNFDHGVVEIAGHKALSIPVPKDSIGTIPRERLGEYMAEKTVATGVELKRETEVVAIGKEAVEVRNGDVYTFDYLIGGDGSDSIVRKYLKLPTKRIGPTIQYKLPKVYDEIEIFFDVEKYGPFYIWIFPHDTFTEVGTGAFTSMVPFAKVREYFEEWCAERDIDLSEGELRSAPINCDYRGFQFDNVFLLGDAAGLTDAFSGEGIFPAIVSGREAAKKILDPEYNLPDLQRILRHKRKKERPLEYYEKYNWIVSRYGNSIVYFMLRSKRFQRKLINAFLF